MAGLHQLGAAQGVLAALQSVHARDGPAEERKDALRRQYALVEPHLATHPWLLGEHFTAADAYLFTVTNWAGHVGLDLSVFTALAAFQQRVAARPAVLAALEAEGLLAEAGA